MICSFPVVTTPVKSQGDWIPIHLIRALVAATVAADAEVSVDVRGRREVFALTKPPFVDPSVRES